MRDLDNSVRGLFRGFSLRPPRLLRERWSGTEACRRGGIDRTRCYDWKQRFQLGGLEGLKDLPPIAKSHAVATPVEVI